MTITDTTIWIAAELRADAQQLWALRGPDLIATVQHPLGGGAADDLAQSYEQICAEIGQTQTVPVMVAGAAPVAPVNVPSAPLTNPPGPLPAAALNLPEGVPLLSLPGLSNPKTGAVMQDATARLLGFLDLNPEFDGVICLPGRSTHWALISANEVVSFQSFLTPHLAQASASLLPGGMRDQWDQAAMVDTLTDTISRPELLAARLAEATAQATPATAQVDQTQVERARGQIWGALLGAELAAARSYWLGQNIALIGDRAFATPYVKALEAQYALVTLTDADRMALAGLCAARKQLIRDASTPPTT